MAQAMSVSMTVRIIDEASAEVKTLASAVRDLKAAAAEASAAPVGRASDWAAERTAVQGVAEEIRGLGALRQDTGAITAATRAYQDEAAAVAGVASTASQAGERLVDFVKRRREAERAAFLARQAEEAEAARATATRAAGAQPEARFGAVGPAVGGVTMEFAQLREAAAQAEAPIGEAVAKLHEEAAAVEGVIGKMRELGEAARAAAAPIPPAEGPTFAGMNRPRMTEQPDLGAEAGRNRDWGDYWRDKYGPPPEEHPPSATRPAEPEHAGGQPPATATGGGGGIISMIVGGAELGSGWKLVKGSYHEAADAAGQRSAMRAAGVPDDEARELAGAASRVSRERGVFSDNETMELARDARTILGSTAHAVEALPKIVDLATLAEAQRPGEGREGVMSLLKGMETSGATVSPERFGELAQSLAKVTNVFGKTISFSDWGQFFKYAGTAGQHMSPDFIEQKLPHLIQELGGSSAGTMFQTMERALIGGQMTPKAARALDKYGLVDPSKVHYGAMSVTLDAGAVKNADEFMRDPSAWVMNNLKPAMDGAHVSEGERAHDLDEMFSNRLTARGMSILENQDANVQKNAAQIRAARGLEAAPDLVRDNPALANRSFSSQVGNLERRAGDPVISPLIALERGITEGVIRANQVFDRAPGAATAAVAGIVGGAGYLGWKTWESGIGDTVRSVLRLPEAAGKGIVQGIADGVGQAKAEAATPKAAPGAAEAAGGAAAAAEGLASRFAAVSTDLGTIGMLAAWASQSDRGVGLRHPLTPEQMAYNPLHIDLGPPPAEPARATAPAAAADPEAPGLVASVTGAIKAGFFALAGSAATAENPLPSAVAPPAAPSAPPAAKPTAADAPPQQVTNNNQQTVTVNAPVTVNATVNNTTPGAIGGAVAGAVHAGVAAGLRGSVRNGAGALHDGTETK